MDKIELISEFIRMLREERSPIIVEGKNDREALEKFGINNIHTISGKPVYKFAERMQGHRSVIILMDRDKKGRMLKSELLQNLERLHIKADLRYEEMLGQTELSHIEGLPQYYKNRGGRNGKDSTCIRKIHNPRQNRRRGCG
jgi:5S rRNA maturation endonuclease (ribonuclease M5)